MYGGLGPDPWLAGPVFGACVVAAVLASELLITRPTGAVRTAGLTPRRVRDYLPRRHGPLLGLLLVAQAAVAAALMTVTSRMAASGSLLSYSCPNGSVMEIPRAALSPALGVLVSVVGGGGVCLLALRKIAARPALPTSSPSRTMDNALRAASTEAVTLAWGCLVASSLLASALLANAYTDVLATAPCNVSGLLPFQVTSYLLIAGSAAALIHLLVHLARLSTARKAAA
ncbi:hypothetical protein OKJ48_00290 [Streptomyces kunmingensis]|uniref:Uncharacterized protein n=1 Tax=Streptomyces kunmingensis TaxID=68225 RepID=A0ABU6C1W6_9ACTN|nr:hypothetical protein [Streptomyces kunmingensis]MEB3958703.1 hypothetical protein [Streptomyces kunmingensis]